MAHGIVEEWIEPWFRQHPSTKWHRRAWIWHEAGKMVSATHGLDRDTRLAQLHGFVAACQHVSIQVDSDWSVPPLEEVQVCLEVTEDFTEMMG